MKTVKTILKYMFATGAVGLLNPVLWILVGCITPIVGMIFGSDTYSKPVNPAAIVFWVGGFLSIIYNVVWFLKDKKQQNKKNI